MATQRKSTPKAATSLAGLATAIATLPSTQQFASANAMFQAAAPGTPKHVCTTARGVLRNVGNGVGRGRRYGITPKQWLSAHKQLQASRAQARSTKQVAQAKSSSKVAA